MFLKTRSNFYLALYHQSCSRLKDHLALSVFCPEKSCPHMDQIIYLLSINKTDRQTPPESCHLVSGSKY